MIESPIKPSINATLEGFLDDTKYITVMNSIYIDMHFIITENMDGVFDIELVHKDELDKTLALFKTNKIIKEEAISYYFQVKRKNDKKKN